MRYVYLILIVICCACVKKPLLCTDFNFDNLSNLTIGDSLIADATCSENFDMVVWQLSKNNTIIHQTKDSKFGFKFSESGKYTLTQHIHKMSSVGADRPAHSIKKEFGIIVN